MKTRFGVQPSGGRARKPPEGGTPNAALARSKRFKRQAVEHWIKSRKNGAQIAAELGLRDPGRKGWKRRYIGDATAQLRPLGMLDFFPNSPTLQARIRFD